MDKAEYEIGRSVWIHNGGPGNPLIEGEIAHKFKLDWGPTQYVVEIATPIDPLLLVRDWSSISEGPNLPINLWRQAQARRSSSGLF